MRSIIDSDIVITAQNCTYISSFCEIVLISVEFTLELWRFTATDKKKYQISKINEHLAVEDDRMLNHQMVYNITLLRFV